MFQKERDMATVKKTSNKLLTTEEKLTEDKLISFYMEYVLEHERMPKSVFKFCKDNNITEEEFYNFYGSFDGLKKGIWNKFYENTMSVMTKSPEFETFTSREKLLTFYYTFFEVLAANRSYVLFSLGENQETMKNLDQLKGLRRKVKSFAKELVRLGNKEKSLKQSEMVFSEATWIQMLFIIKFWMDDNSAQFESTDVVIEKSVNTVFEVFDNTPLERILDLGKFLWKEKMA